MKRSFLFILATAALLVGCSLAGDVTPPPSLATAQASEPLVIPLTTPAQVSPPAIPPNPAAGEEIYQTRCSPCHGPQGQGDGEQSANLPNPPAPLGDPEFSRTVKPADWYSIVSIGRLDRFMPGFASLSDSQRWDVVAFALTLSTTEETLSEGAQVYNETCASCHSSSGEGTARGPALNAPGFMADRSIMDVFTAASDGVGGEMPGFADSLTDDQRSAVAYFVRSLAFTAETDIGNLPAASASPASFGSIRGRATNGTAGASLEGELEVNLLGFDADSQVVSATARVGSDGSFVFDGLDIVEGRIFGVTMLYKGIVYYSEAAHLSQTSPDIDLPLVVYETTAEAGQIRVDRLHLIFDFTGADTLRVLELWVLSNDGDRTLAGADGRGVIRLPLPSGATNLGFPGDASSQDLQFTDEGVVVSAPLFPGSGTGEVVFNFDLPYDRRLSFSQEITYPVGAVVALLPAGGPELSGSGWQDLGVRDVGGISYQNHTLGALFPGQTLDLTLSGQSGTTGSTGGGISTSNIAVGLGVLGLTLVAVGLWWYRPWRRPTAERVRTVEEPPPPAGGDPEIDTVIRQIADLDDDYEAGVIQEKEYRRRRAALKRRALDLRLGQDD